MTQNGTKKNGLNKLTLGPYPDSKKVYLKGNVFPEIRIPLRKINLDKNTIPNNIHLYDTSGIYSELNKNKNYNIANGLKPIRLNWITERQNVIKYKGRKVTYKDNGFLKENSKILKSFKKKKFKLLQSKKKFYNSVIFC